MRLSFCTAIVVLCAITASPRPASAQVDLSGVWAPIFHEDQVERLPGPDVGDFAGLPINDAARLRAESWEPSLLTLPEHQCKPHPSTYGFRGVGNLRIWNVLNDEDQQLIAIRTHIFWQEQQREIWMDDRPRPPAFAAHTWQGFSKGRWEGKVLVVETDHLKAGWIRRNGVALSDRAHMTERFYRHGNILTHVYIIEDPVYLTEPLVRTNGFQLTTDLYFNGEAVQLIHEPGAHSDGDTLVYFRKSDVIVSGDLYVTTTFPVVELEQGGDIRGVVKAANDLIKITVPKEKQEGGTYVIPGHGRLADEADVVEYRDMLTIIRDRFQDSIDRGMSLEKVKAARLVRDYEGRYGASSGPWTTNAFVEAVYRSLMKAPAQ